MNQRVATALQFPRPASKGATRFQILRSRLSVTLGLLLQRFRVPGAVRDSDIDDSEIGYRIRVRTGPLFTRININGRDYFFCRYTGRFDGTGSGCA